MQIDMLLINSATACRYMVVMLTVEAHVVITRLENEERQRYQRVRTLLYQGYKRDIPDTGPKR
jgi:hypothetical protein